MDAEKKLQKKIHAIPWIVIVSGSIALVIFLTAVLAPMIAPFDPNKINLYEALQPPSFHHLLGTDKTGRDLFSRLLFGSRSTLLFSLLVVMITSIIGVPLGLVCGYFEGRLDAVIMRVWDVILAFPALLLAFVFVAMFGRGVQTAVIALGIVYVPQISRLTRSLTLAEKNKVHVEFERSAGFSSFRIIFLHILPNCASTIFVQITANIAYAILDLASLSYLGLGVQPPTSDWGTILSEGQAFLQTNPLMALSPGLAIIVSVVSINLLSDGLQTYWNPKQAKLPTFRKYRRLAGGQNG